MLKILKIKFDAWLLYKLLDYLNLTVTFNYKKSK